MTDSMLQPTGYNAQSARDAQRTGVGTRGYWDYLELAALRHAVYYLERGDHETARKMLTRSLSEALAGNDGD